MPVHFYILISKNNVKRKTALIENERYFWKAYLIELETKSKK